MRLLMLALLLPLMIQTISVTEPRDDANLLPTFTCTVLRVGVKDRVECKTRNPIPECQNSKAKFCKTLVMDLDTGNPVFRNWKLRVAETINAEPIEAPLQKGQQLLATWDNASGMLLPIASCEVRVQQRLQEFFKNRPGEALPKTARIVPDDCRREGKR